MRGGNAPTTVSFPDVGAAARNEMVANLDQGTKHYLVLRSPHGGDWAAVRVRLLALELQCGSSPSLPPSLFSLRTGG